MGMHDWQKVTWEDFPPRGVCADCGDPAVHHYSISGFGPDAKKGEEHHLCHPCDQRRNAERPPPVMITPMDVPTFSISEEPPLVPNGVTYWDTSTDPPVEKVHIDGYWLPVKDLED